MMMRRSLIIIAMQNSEYIIRLIYLCEYGIICQVLVIIKYDKQTTI